MFRAGVVEAELALLKDARPDHPARRGIWRSNLPTPGMSAVRRQYGAPLLVLLAISGLVLGIACVNVANLLLHARERAPSRNRRPLVAWAPHDARVVRQLLTESMLLATAGAAVGIALAYAGCRYLLAFFSDEPYADRRWRSGPICACSRLPAPSPSRPACCLVSRRRGGRRVRAPGTSLMGSGRVRGSRDRQVLSRMLIAGQVALSVMMLFSAGLFLRSLHNLHSIDTGFDSSSVLLISTDASRSRLTPGRSARGFPRSARTVRRAPRRTGSQPQPHHADRRWRDDADASARGQRRRGASRGGECPLELGEPRLFRHHEHADLFGP